MSRPPLSVLIPTTGRREELLFRVEQAVRFTVPQAEILTVEGKTWGAGLNELIPLARGAYVSCCCDDTIPVQGWFDAGRKTLDAGMMPASRYLNPDGSPLRPGWDDAEHGARIPWCRSFLLTHQLYETVGPFIDATWFADIDYSERLVLAGRPVVACDGYSFVHLDGERDWQTGEVTAREEEAYKESHRRQGIPA
jgi:hypothetical protein